MAIVLSTLDELEKCQLTLEEEKSHLEMLVNLQNPAACVDNVQTILRAIVVGDAVLPVTVNSCEYNTSYVCSIYTAFVSYARAELHKINSTLTKVGLKALIGLFDIWLRAAKIDRVISHNNFLLSTNLYPKIQFSDADIKVHLNRLADQYPRHAIIFRSLNAFTNMPLIESLKRCSFTLVPSRQVYIFDRQISDYRKRSNYLVDLKLLRKQKKYQLVSGSQFNNDDYERIAQIYSMLYIDKYSQYNPMFNAEYMRLTNQSGMIDYMGMRNSDGVLDAVLGCYDRAGVSTAPIVGYDTTLPQNLGLYRMLIAYCIDRADQKGLILNMSAGASHFKKLRGGVPYIEYSALYTRHLSNPFQRFTWQSLRFLLMHVMVPVMRKYEL